MPGVHLLLALAVLAQCCSEALGGISVTPSRSPFVCDDGTAKSGSDELLIWGGAWAHAPELPGAGAGPGPETVYHIEARSIVRILVFNFLAPFPSIPSPIGHHRYLCVYGMGTTTRVATRKQGGGTCLFHRRQYLALLKTAPKKAPIVPQRPACRHYHARDRSLRSQTMCLPRSSSTQAGAIHTHSPSPSRRSACAGSSSVCRRYPPLISTYRLG